MSIHPRQGLPRDYHYNVRDWDGWYSANPLGGRWGSHRYSPQAQDQKTFSLP